MSHFLPGSCALRPAHRYRCVSLPMHPSSRPGPGRGFGPSCPTPAPDQPGGRGPARSSDGRRALGCRCASVAKLAAPRIPICATLCRVSPGLAGLSAPRRRALDHARTTHGSGLRLAASGCSVRIPPDRVRRARRMGGASRAATGDPRHLVCGEKTGRLDVDVLLEDERQLQEAFAGIGSGETACRTRCVTSPPTLSTCCFPRSGARPRRTR